MTAPLHRGGLWPTLTTNNTARGASHRGLCFVFFQLSDRLAPHHTVGYAGRAFLTRPAERFERNGFDNLSVICFANATVSLRLSHGAGLTAHRAVIQHRAAASLPYTGEAIRCGGIIDIKTDKLLAPARAFRSGQGGRAQAYGLYVKPGQRGHGRKDPAGYQHIRSINHEQKVS